MMVAAIAGTNDCLVVTGNERDLDAPANAFPQSQPQKPAHRPPPPIPSITYSPAPPRSPQDPPAPMLA